MKKQLLFLTTVFMMATTTAQADQLVFKNGDNLTGELYHVDHDMYHFKTSFGSMLAIPRDQVASYSASEDDFDVVLSNDDNHEVSSKAVDIEEIKSDVIVANTQSTQSSSFVYEAIEKNLGLKTSGYFRLGGNLQEGNTEKSGFKVQGELKTELDKKNRVTVRGQYAYAEEDGVVSENARSFSGIYDHFLSEKWFATSNAKFKTDKEADLDLQTTLGFGLGYQPYKSDDINLSFTLGPTYLIEEFETGNKEESTTARWALDYDQQFFDKRLKLFHNHTILQSFDNTDNFQLDSVTGASVPITDHFKGILQVDYDFDNMPAVGSKREDTTYSLNLGYEW